MILALDWIRGGTAGPKDPRRQVLAEKAQLISTGKEGFESLVSDENVKSKSATGDVNRDEEVQEVGPEDIGGGGRLDGHSDDGED